MVFVAVYQLAPAQRPAAVAGEAFAAGEAGETDEAVSEVYYPGCNAVRAAGAAPLYRGQPGYRPQMDGDDDGIACEPYRGY